MPDMLETIPRGVLNVLDKPVSLDWPGGFWGHWALYAVGLVVLLLVGVMGFIWFERRFLGAFQIRIGPNRAGPFGLLQPMADALKVMLKEDIVVALADKIVHLVAPILVFVPVLMMLAVIPIQDGVGLIPDLNVGLLYIVAIGSLETVAVFMAGWGSNNKYAMIAAVRSIAQMISYEIPMVLAMAAVVLASGSLSMQEIVRQQNIPFIFLLPLSFFLYLTGALAELQRTPFDLLEADSEIVAGYHIEYSGMKFAMFYLAEYGSTFVVSAITTTIFLGGWRGPLLPPFLWFFIKVFLVFAFIIWIRGTWPRIRIDQMMEFAWKFLLPLALANVVIVAVEAIFWPTFPWPLVFLNIGLMVLLLGAWAGVLKLRGGADVEA